MDAPIGADPLRPHGQGADLAATPLQRVAQEHLAMQAAGGAVAVDQRQPLGIMLGRRRIGEREAVVEPAPAVPDREGDVAAAVEG